MPRRPALLHAIGVGLLGAALAGACSSAPPSGPMALYDTSAARDDFFALPWPSDARLKGSGPSATFDLTGFHDPGGLIGQYIALLEGEPQGGFGPSAGIFFRFDGAIDPASLPATAAASIDPAATVFVVDVTPGSPTAGKRAPIHVAFKSDSGKYIGANSLALLPAPGLPLRPKTTYAAIITDGVRGAVKDGGAPVRADSRFTMPALPMTPAGLDVSHIVCATVFTTSDPTTGMKALHDAVYSSAPPAAIDPGSLKWLGSPQDGFDQYEGTFASPNFQQGDPPYLSTGGGIKFDGSGVPQIARIEHLRFMLTVPQGAPPPSGWPIVLYAHGTGGDYSTFVEDGSATSATNVKDDNDVVIARMAMISTDQPNHGPRDPTMSDPDLTTYNFQNITSARDIFRQGASDDFQLLRLAEAISVDAAPHTNSAIHLDQDHIFFKGHSQGGTSGPLFLAFEPRVSVAVLSGAGGNLITALLNKTQPNNIAALVGVVLGEDPDEFHPLMSLLQTYLEPADPSNYGRLFIREPPVGQSPKSVYQSLGITDHYTPVPAIKALALSMGVEPANPMLTPLEDDVSRLVWADPPVVKNLAAGAATGVLCEYQVPLNQLGQQSFDGHFVVFKMLAAIRQSNRFLAYAARDGVAKLDP